MGERADMGKIQQGRGFQEEGDLVVDRKQQSSSQGE